MEKQLKLRNKILKILPRAAAAVTMTFQNPPFSPGRDHHKTRPDQNAASRWQHNRHHHHHHHGGKGLSGPIVPMIPNNGDKRNGNNIDNQEPTSPKISCMGTIKSSSSSNKKNKHAKKTVDASGSSTTSREVEVKKHVSAFQKMLLLHHQHHGANKAPKSAPGRKSDASAAQGNKGELMERAPHVSQMKRFASGRDTFADFDWKAHQAVEIDDCYSDEGRRESDFEEEDDDGDYRIPFSAPILLGGGQGDALNLKPRKEINLWKRRTMAPPRPLQLST